jgi:DNA helicase-2/ATP-dependent DNA helicase PcrA
MKTEMIANVAAQCQRALVLTHTHAGVHAIRARLKRMRIPHRQTAVDTIAGWSTRYAHAFPGVARPPPGDPRNKDEWDQLYRGPTQALSVPAIREVVRASYDRVLVDEYQDCSLLQHQLAVAVSTIVPTLIFGDEMGQRTRVVIRGSTGVCSQAIDLYFVSNDAPEREARS